MYSSHHLTMVLLLTWKYLKCSALLPTALCLRGPCHHLCTHAPFSILPIISPSARACFADIETFKKLHSSPAGMRATCSLLADFVFLGSWTCQFDRVIPKRLSYFPYFCSWFFPNSDVLLDSPMQIIHNNHISNHHQRYIVGKDLKLYSKMSTYFWVLWLYLSWTFFFLWIHIFIKLKSDLRDHLT